MYILEEITPNTEELEDSENQHNNAHHSATCPPKVSEVHQPQRCYGVVPIVHVMVVELIYSVRVTRRVCDNMFA